MNCTSFNKPLSLIVLFLTFVVDSLGQDSTKKPWEFHGNIQVNNNGISPVPAFTLGKPALMSSFAITKGSFSFSPEYNMSLEARPWVINEWFRYRIPSKKSFYQLGVNFSQFFSEKIESVTGNKFSKMNRYAVAEGMYGTTITDHFGLRLTYWFSGALDTDGVKSGHFIMASIPISGIGSASGLNLNVIPNLFYINNTIPFKGTFTSVIASAGFKQFPVRVSGQIVQPIKADNSLKFNWNFGLNYSF